MRLRSRDASPTTNSRTSLSVLLMMVCAMPVPGRKATPSPGFQPPQFAVEPQIGLAFENESKLLLIGLGMRPGNPPPGHQALMMDADPHHAEFAAIGGADRLQFVRALIVIVVAALDIAPMRDEIVADHDRSP